MLWAGNLPEIQAYYVALRVHYLDLMTHWFDLLRNTADNHGSILELLLTTNTDKECRAWYLACFQSVRIMIILPFFLSFNIQGQRHEFI